MTFPGQWIALVSPGARPRVLFAAKNIVTPQFWLHAVPVMFAEVCGDVLTREILPGN